MEANKLKQIDDDYRNHLQAFLNFAVKAEKKAGKNRTKPVYTKFKQFYDYEKEIKKAKEKDKSKARFSNLSKLMKKGV